MPFITNCELTFVADNNGRVTYAAGTPVEPCPKAKDGEAKYCTDRAAWLNRLEGERPVYVAVVLNGLPRILQRSVLQEVPRLPQLELDDLRQVVRPVRANALF